MIPKRPSRPRTKATASSDRRSDGPGGHTPPRSGEPDLAGQRILARIPLADDQSGSDVAVGDRLRLEPLCYLSGLPTPGRLDAVSWTCCDGEDGFTSGQVVALQLEKSQGAARRSGPAYKVRPKSIWMPKELLDGTQTSQLVAGLTQSHDEQLATMRVRHEAELQAEQAKHEADLKDVTEAVAKLRTERDELQSKVDMLQTRKKATQREVKENEAKKSELENDILDLIDMQADLDAIPAALREKQAELAALQSEVDAIESARDDVLTREGKCDVREKDVESREAAASESERRLTTRKTALDAREKDINQRQGELRVRLERLDERSEPTVSSDLRTEPFASSEPVAAAAEPVGQTGGLDGGSVRQGGAFANVAEMVTALQHRFRRSGLDDLEKVSRVVASVCSCRVSLLPSTVWADAIAEVWQVPSVRIDAAVDWTGPEALWRSGLADLIDRGAGTDGPLLCVVRGIDRPVAPYWLGSLADVLAGEQESVYLPDLGEVRIPESLRLIVIPDRDALAFSATGFVALSCCPFPVDEFDATANLNGQRPLDWRESDRVQPDRHLSGQLWRRLTSRRETLGGADEVASSLDVKVIRSMLSALAPSVWQEHPDRGAEVASQMRLAWAEDVLHEFGEDAVPVRSPLPSLPSLPSVPR